MINLDPATATLPYTAQIDIRQTVNYKEVMKQYADLLFFVRFAFAHGLSRYELGPNGGILTSLNLFTTKFDQVLDLVEKRAPSLKYAMPLLFATWLTTMQVSLDRHAWPNRNL